MLMIFFYGCKRFLWSLSIGIVAFYLQVFLLSLIPYEQVSLDNFCGTLSPQRLCDVWAWPSYIVGAMGDSFFYGSRVWSVVWERVLWSAMRGLGGFVMLYVVLFALHGMRLVLSGGVRGKILRMIVLSMMMSAYAIPPLCWVMSMDVAYQRWGGCYVWVVLAYMGVYFGGFCSLFWRLCDDAWASEYVYMARSRGASRLHCFSFIAVPQVLLKTVSKSVSVLLHMMFFGAFLIEKIFALKGIGALSLEAFYRKDYSVFLSISYVYMIFSVILYTIRDVLLKKYKP